MTSEVGGVRLGDLLTQAGLLRPEELREAMQIAKHQSLPVGRVLIMSGFLSDSQLRAAVQAQSLLKDDVINLETVLQALSIVGKSEMALEDAFRQLGLDVLQSQPTNKLGELLMEAELISREALDQALQQSTTNGLPLGRILLLTGVVVEPLLSSALNAQVLIRDHKITREQAIQGLKAARDRQISLEQSLAETGMQLPLHSTIRLGELLVMAGIMPDTNLMDYVELGLVQELPLGQVLIAQNIITEHILTNALELQKMVAAGSLGGEQAALVLNLVASGGTTIQEVLQAQEPQKELVVETVPLYQFLQLAGRITPQQIEEAVRNGTRDAQLMGLMLHRVGAIGEFEMSVALALNDFMGKNIVSIEQSIVALNYCITRQISLEEAFSQMGWILNQPYNSYTSKSTAANPEATPALQEHDPVYSHANVDPNTTAVMQPLTDSELHLSTAELDEQAAKDAAETANAPALTPPSGYTPLPTAEGELKAADAWQPEADPSVEQPSEQVPQAESAPQAAPTETEGDAAAAVQEEKPKTRKRLADLVP